MSSNKPTYQVYTVECTNSSCSMRWIKRGDKKECCASCGHDKSRNIQYQGVVN